MSKAGNGKMGLWAVVSLGVGGMVGGGIFAVLGLAVQLAHGGTPVAFALAGMVALLTAYSYAKLSVAYPSRGGTVVFLDRTFGTGMFTGSLNVLLWLSYVVMLSLYAFAFGSYGATFLPQAWQGIGKHGLISFAVIEIAGMNLLNAELIGKAEIWIVAIKLAILLLFVGVGVFGINTSQIAPGSWSPPLQMAEGGMIIFLAYEGFELIANVFDLTSIATMGSAGFLLIFAAVNSANARHAPHTHSRGWISAAGALACLLAFGALVWQTAMTEPAKLWVLAAMLALAVLIEGAFRLAKREIRLHE